MRLHALALLGLALALAGCTVDGSTLRPRSDAECKTKDSCTKACGYLCVPDDDPATHCDTVGDCSPCPGPWRNQKAICGRSGCALRCDYGWADCNGVQEDGCETQLFKGDPQNCGACGRTCTGCLEGACPGNRLALSPAPVLPRGIVTHQGAVYYVDATGGGQLRSVDSGGAVVASGLGADPRWAASWPDHGVLVTGDVPAASGTGRDLAISQVDAGGVTSTLLSTPGGAGEGIDGLAVDGGIVLFTRTAADGVWAFDANYGTTLALQVRAPRGLTFHKGRTYVGSTAATPAEIRWLKGAIGSGWTTGVAQSGTTSTPSRLAIYDNPDRVWTPFVFWISEGDGSVRGAPADASGDERKYAEGGASAVHADIVADAEGVYWSNWAKGEITMWRASDGVTFTIATSAHPRALALRGTTLYWTDDGTNPSAVYSTPIPLR